MKKSNKLSVIYVITSIVLLLVLIGGGIYGVYVSVGLNFVRSNINNFTESTPGLASNVSFGGTVNFQPSMTGVIILSISLIVIGIFDIVALIKQVIFFKQFKAIRESKFEQKVESKTKSKGAVVFFAIVIDFLSVVAGIAGIFINARAFSGGNVVWVLYVIDGFVAILAIISFVLLLIKIKKSKELLQSENKHKKDNDNFNEKTVSKQIKIDSVDINEIEYQLLKLKFLKSAKIINQAEFEKLRKTVLGEPEIHKEVENNEK